MLRLFFRLIVLLCLTTNSWGDDQQVLSISLPPVTIDLSPIADQVLQHQLKAGLMLLVCAITLFLLICWRFSRRATQIAEGQQAVRIQTTTLVWLLVFMMIFVALALPLLRVLLFFG